MLLSGVALRKDKFSHKIRTIAFIRIGENVFVFPWHLLFFFLHKPTELALASRGDDAVYAF